MIHALLVITIILKGFSRTYTSLRSGLWWLVRIRSFRVLCVGLEGQVSNKNIHLFLFLIALDEHPFGLVSRKMGCWMSIKSIGHQDQSKWGGHFLDCSHWLISQSWAKNSLSSSAGEKGGLAISWSNSRGYCWDARRSHHYISLYLETYTLLTRCRPPSPFFFFSCSLYMTLATDWVPL